MLHAATKTQCSQINKYWNKKQKRPVWSKWTEGGRWRVVGEEVGKVRGGQRSAQPGPLWRLCLSFKWNKNPRDGVRQWSDMIWFLFQRDPLNQDGGSETSVLFTWITKEQTSQVLAPLWALQAIRPHKPVPMGGPLLPIHHAMNRKLQLPTAKCQRSDVNQGFKYMCDVSGEETRLTTPPGDSPQGHLLLTFKFP